MTILGMRRVKIRSLRNDFWNGTFPDVEDKGCTWVIGQPTIVETTTQHGTNWPDELPRMSEKQKKQEIAC